MRVGYLGPEGTFSHEAALSLPEAPGAELVGCTTIHETVMAVADGVVDRAVVPIENTIEGGVSATLDALVFEAPDVRIVGETVHPIRQCLIAREAIDLAAVTTVVSHPHATGQCTRFLRERLPGARLTTTTSTADAVRLVAEHGDGWAAIGNRLAAERWGCRVLLDGVEDVAGNETRFVWLARGTGQHGDGDGVGRGPTGPRPEAWKTAIVFWGAGSEAPGWLVACLSEFAARGVNLTRIESRPRKVSLGRYIFFVDLEGQESDEPVAAALAAAREHVETLRVLGTFVAAEATPVLH